LVGLEINNNNYMTLLAYIPNEKEGVHKKQGCKTYCENKCGKGNNIDPIHVCIPTILSNIQLLDHKESTSCQCGYKVKYPFTEYSSCMCEWAL
jgi:hypothetical protein